MSLAVAAHERGADSARQYSLTVGKSGGLFSLSGNLKTVSSAIFVERGRRCGDGGAGTYAPRTYVHIGGIFHRDQDVAVTTKIARIESTSALGGGVGGGIRVGGVAAASAAAAAAAAAAKNSFAM